MKALLTVVLLMCAGAALAQERPRPIPEAAKSGTMSHVEDMTVEIDGQKQRLAPGAQIRDESNRIVMPAAVPAGSKVKYIVDDDGMLRQVWILTPEEKEKP